MLVQNKNRFFMHRSKQGKFVISANVDGKQVVMVAFPELNEDGEGISHWQGNIRPNNEPED